MACESHPLRPSRRLLATALLPVLLGGCAAVAIPVLAGGAILRDRVDGDGKPDPDTRPERISIDYNAPPGTPLPSAEPAPVASASAPPANVQSSPPAVQMPLDVATATAPPPPEPIRPAPTRIAAVTVATRAAIPAAQAPAIPPLPADSGAPDPYAAFASFALSLAPPPPPGTTRRSALVDQETIADQPQLSECDDSPPAVVIDLDPGGTSFDPTDPPLPAPGLAERLAQLRAGGLTVLWSASVPIERAQEVWTVLRATGLDPDRTDRLVLPRRANERKQTRRLAAGREWCIVAIAGDRRDDFDEVFDYLRDPDGPIAEALNPALGRGWFLVPTPIE